MNLNTMEKIPYSKKKILVKEACLMYSKIKLVSQFVKGQPNQEVLNDFVQVSNINSIKTSSLFETALNMLTKDELTVIENDFLNHTNSQWWVNTWSKTTYYKIKHQAIDKFLYLFYV